MALEHLFSACYLSEVILSRGAIDKIRVKWGHRFPHQGGEQYRSEETSIERGKAGNRQRGAAYRRFLSSKEVPFSVEGQDQRIKPIALEEVTDSF
jgi:hypothetical protein